MPSQSNRSINALVSFESGPSLFEPAIRHSAVIVRDDSLAVFWIRFGDTPESIMFSTIDLRPDWMSWQHLWQHLGECIVLKQSINAKARMLQLNHLCEVQRME